MNEAQSLKSVAPVISPSSTTREKGWMYLVLRPGVYYLLVVPPGSEQKQPAVELRSSYGRYVNGVFKPILPFQFHVAKGEDLVYVGSLSVSCKGKHKAFGHFIKECSDISVTNETKSAQEIAQTSFNQHGPLSTSLMMPYDKHITPYATQELVPMGVLKTSQVSIMQEIDNAIGTKEMGRKKPEPPPDIILRKTFKQRAEVMGEKGAIATDLMLASCEIPYLWLITIPIWLGYEAYLPFEFATKEAMGELTVDKWQSRIQELHQEVREFDTLHTTQQTLKKWMSNYGLPPPVVVESEEILLQASQYGLKSILQAEILRVQLRECEKDLTFYVEVAIRVRLLDPGTNRYLYNKVLLYTGHTRDLRDTYFKQSYELPIFVFIKCRNVKDYFNEAGRRILREEISKAVTLSIEKVCNDLDLYEQSIVEHTYSQTIEESIEDSKKTLEDNE
jgi:hypothetical protein